MRIACVHIPQFALQCVTRVDPSLRGAAVAVVGAGVDPVAGTVSRVALHSPVVQACSRAAWALGVRIGMTATAARSVSPELSVVTADATLERDTVRAMADVLLGAGAAAANPVVVDLGGRVGPAGAHFAMYCEVPSKTRGTTFGDRLVERLTALGLTARIGIADDRFTAWVAASSGSAASTTAAASGSAGKSRMTDAVTVEDHAVISVPRGGSAAFLAPRPLSLLSIPPEVQHMLESLGVSTLGEFAALPPPSVHLAGPIGMRSRPVEADFQALARGDSGTALRAYTPDSPIAEQAIISESTSMPAAVALLAERIAMRLAGRGRGATRLELHVTTAAPAAATTAGAGTPSPRVNVIATSAIRDGKVVESGEDLADAIGKAVVGSSETDSRSSKAAAPTASAAGTITKLRVVVTGEAVAGDVIAAELADTVAASARVSLADALSNAASTVAAAGAMVARTAKQATLRLVPDELAEIEDAVHETASSVAAVIDPLEVVLSNTGSGSWQLTTPSLRDERRDAHRRTQRGKERRQRARVQQALVQPRLFKTV